MVEAFFSCEQSKPRTPATPYCDTYYVICLETKTAGFPRKARHKHLSKIFLRSKQSKILEANAAQAFMLALLSRLDFWKAAGPKPYKSYGESPGNAVSRRLLCNSSRNEQDKKREPKLY